MFLCGPAATSQLLKHKCSWHKEDSPPSDVNCPSVTYETSDFINGKKNCSMCKLKMLLVEKASFSLMFHPASGMLIQDASEER